MSASQGSILSSFDPMDNEAVENLIKDDEQLRGCGFPQQLLIALRSVGYKTVQILQLPPPNLSPSGEILNEYWYDLRNRGVPQSVLPSRLFDQRPPTRAEQELNSYASLAAGYTHTPSTQGGAGAASFAARFGSPVRPMPSLGPSTGTGTGAHGTGGSLGTPGSSHFGYTGAFPTPFGSQLPTPPVGTDYIKHIDIAMSTADWQAHRAHLMSSGSCMVYHAFAISDKQFQTLVTSVKVPSSFRNVGIDNFNADSWRDLKEYFEALDVWNVFCAILCGNFRATLDGNDSLSLGASVLAQTIQSAPLATFLGHSDLSIALSRWHASNVLDSPSVLWSSLSAVVLRDRLLRPALLQAINHSAKDHLRSTFIHDNT